MLLPVLVDKEGRKQGWTIEIDPPNSYLIVPYKNDVRFGKGYMVRNRFEIFEAEFNGTDTMEITRVETTYKTITREGYRFEGAVRGDMPFGFGQLYSIRNFTLVYSGMMVGWKRFGFGSSYFSFGIAEYCGYWVDDMWHGQSTMHNTKEMYKNDWCFGLSLGKYSVYKRTGLLLNGRVMHRSAFLEFLFRAIRSNCQ